MPYDPALESGSSIEYPDLQPATKVAAGRVSFRGLIAKPDGSHVLETTREGAAAQASALGADAGRELKERAGAGFFTLA